MQKFALHTKKPVAVDSPDHIQPWGTKDNNSRNILFNMKLALLLGNRQLDILDFGCSGGGFVKSCIEQGHRGIGLEGSDFSQRTRRAEWGTIPESLFTCDITAEFHLACKDPTTGWESDAQFDVITAWEFIEHIKKEDLPQVCRNALRHLKPGGVWIMSVSPRPEVINGVALHQTVEERGWWLRFFESQGFTNQPGLVEYFGDDWVRGPLQYAPGSFHVVLVASGSQPPAIPQSAAYDANDILRTAREFIDSGRFEYALRLVRRAVNMYPTNADVLASLGNLGLHFSMIELSRARTAMTQAAGICPTHPQASQVIGQIDAAMRLLRGAAQGNDSNIVYSG
jgi:SAM-dependent methyltransferase